MNIRPAGCRHGSRPAGFKRAVLFLSLSLIFVVIVGGSLAYLHEESDSVTNAFAKGRVDDEIEETIEGNAKKIITVKNTGEVSAYMRVRLVSYRVDGGGNHVGGDAEIDNPVWGDFWVGYGDYYYFTVPVEPGKATGNLLCYEGIELKNYPDGSHQVIEVLADAVQATPQEAVCEAWGVTISPNNVRDCQEGET